MKKFKFTGRTRTFFLIYFLFITVWSQTTASCVKDTDWPDYLGLLQDEPLSQDYEVFVNGKPLVVYVARVQDAPWEPSKTKLDFGGNYSFTSFDITGPVEVIIRSKNRLLSKTIFRPDNSRVRRIALSENEITFSIDKPIHLSIEPDGKRGPLLLFANAKETFVPDKNDPNVIWFGPGIHKPDSMLVRVRENQTLYLAEGAIVKCGVIVQGNNAKILGRGIIDGNDFVWGKGARNLILVRGNNVVVKDVILRGAATWSMPLRNCSNIEIENIKILGGRAQNDDGINPCNATDVHINHCFIRTDDDCIALKGMQTAPFTKNVENIVVENSILWCDRARIFLLGHESRAEFMRNLRFRNIDILHFKMTAFLLEPGEEMKLQDVLFEDFRIHGETDSRELIRLKPTVNQYMRNKVPGYLSNITFKNIRGEGAENTYKIQMMGADEQHAVKDILLENVSVNGTKIKAGSPYLQIEDFVIGLQFK
jgi:hypothetical protein